MMKRKRVFSMFLAIILIVTAAFSVFAVDPATITRGEAASLIFNTAKRYNANIELDSILSGYEDGGLYKEKPATNAEIFVMFTKAFGEIPEAKGNNKRIAYTDTSYTDVPEWAKSHFEALQKAGVLFSNGNSATAVADKNEVSLMLDRMMRLYGNNAKDDFYEYVNKEWLDTAGFPEGYSTHDTFGQLSENSVAQIEVILDELTMGTYNPGTSEYLVSTFFKNALARETRNEQGIKPIQKYLDMINGIKTIDDIVSVNNTLYKEIGFYSVYCFSLSGDIYDSNKKTVYFSSADIHLSKDEYVSKNQKKIDALTDKITKSLVLCGEDESEAKQDAEKFIAFEAELANAKLSPQENYDIDLAYEATNLSKLDELFTTVNMENVVKELGITASGDTEILVCDPKAVAQFAKYLSNDYVDLLKTYMKIDFSLYFGTTLSDDFINLSNEYERVVNDAEMPIPYKRRAINRTLATFGEDIGKIYIQKHFSEEAKSDVEHMIQEFIGVYKEKLSENTWLTAETKAKALKKLDTLNYKIGYPDKWDNFLAGYEIKSVSEGGSLFDNVCTIERAYYEKMIAEQNLPPDREEWSMDVYEANAYYDRSFNEIVFPAGILQPPFYDINGKREANLGGIGVVIAHEISHAFDNNGAKHDENGNAVNWWTEKDYAEFEKRCESVKNFYDNIEIAPGIMNNGELTLGENIADLEGVLCTLQVVQKMKDADLKAFFENWAATWRLISTREQIKFRSIDNTHSNARLRINITLRNISEFFETYEIQAGDGMFVPVEDRVKIW